jgi:hypothetical protein
MPAVADGGGSAIVSDAGVAECDAGSCIQREPFACADCLDREVSWRGAIDSFPPPAGLDRNRYTVDGCRTFTSSDPERLGTCSTELPPCGQEQGPTIGDLEYALAHEDVVAAFAGASVFNQAPDPADWYFTVSLDGTTIQIGPRECIAGTACVAVPTGVAALRSLLAEIAAQQACEPRPPDGECLSDARFVQDVCVRCDQDGTCAAREARCARDCSTAPAACTNEIGTTNFTTCTARGLCEAGECEAEASQ